MYYFTVLQVRRLKSVSWSWSQGINKAGFFWRLQEGICVLAIATLSRLPVFIIFWPLPHVCPLLLPSFLSYFPLISFIPLVRTARRSSQSILKEVNPGHSLEGLIWSWSSNTLATWCKEPTHWKRPWCQKRLRAGGEGDDRGWGGWMTSLTWWTWVWANSGRQ